MPQKMFVSAVTWEIVSKVRTASQWVTPPSGCPPDRLFVPETLRSDVIRWSHCSKVACHSGVSRTMFLIKQRFWWPSMARDIQSFVLACSVCAVSKTSNRPSAGLLQPLSVPVETLVPHFARFRHRSPSLKWEHGGFDRGGPVFEGCSFHPSA